MISGSSHITKKQQQALLKAFADDKMATMAAEDCKVHKNTADRWYRHFREKIYHSLRHAPRFFGEVEMDQSEFAGRGHKRMKTLLARYKKVLPYAEYQARAKELRREHKVMVFGILQRGGDVYTRIIKRADTDTLLPIVRLVVEPSCLVFTPNAEKMQKNTIIYTDKWRAFTKLGLDGYIHKSVNHSESYSDKKGTHINGIEAFWSFAKRRLTKFNGLPTQTIQLHIKECEFRYNNKDVLKAMKKVIAGNK